MRVSQVCCTIAFLPFIQASPIVTSGEIISQDQCVSSSSGNFHACLTSNGAFVVRQGLDSKLPDKVVFQGGAAQNKKGIYSARIENGALTIFRTGKKDAEVVWSTATVGGDYLYLDDSGVLTLYQNGYLWDTELWSSIQQTSTESCSNTIKEPTTGITFELLSTSYSPMPLRCLGVGVRVKSIVITTVNVYALAFYVEPKAASKALQKFSKLDLAQLVINEEFYLALMKPASFTRYLVLHFTRYVSAGKVVEALSAVQGVPHTVLKEFQSILSSAIGNAILENETISIGWEGKNKLIVNVRGVRAGSMENVDLLSAIFELYLGKNPISPTAKRSIAEGLSSLYKS